MFNQAHKCDGIKCRKLRFSKVGSSVGHNNINRIIGEKFFLNQNYKHIDKWLGVSGTDLHSIDPIITLDKF